MLKVNRIGNFPSKVMLILTFMALTSRISLKGHKLKVKKNYLKICKIPSSVKSGGRLLQKFTKEQGDSFHANWQSLTQ